MSPKLVAYKNKPQRVAQVLHTVAFKASTKRCISSHTCRVLTPGTAKGTGDDHIIQHTQSGPPGAEAAPLLTQGFLTLPDRGEQSGVERSRDQQCV